MFNFHPVLIDSETPHRKTHWPLPSRQKRRWLQMVLVQSKLVCPTGTSSSRPVNECTIPPLQTSAQAPAWRLRVPDLKTMLSGYCTKTWYRAALKAPQSLSHADSFTTLSLLKNGKDFKWQLMTMKFRWEWSNSQVLKWHWMQLNSCQP